MKKYNPFHYSIKISKMTYEEAYRLRKFLYKIGFEEDDFEYNTEDY